MTKCVCVCVRVMFMIKKHHQSLALVCESQQGTKVAGKKTWWRRVWWERRRLQRHQPTHGVLQCPLWHTHTHTHTLPYIHTDIVYGLGWRIGPKWLLNNFNSVLFNQIQHLTWINCNYPECHAASLSRVSLRWHTLWLWQHTQRGFSRSHHMS